MNNISKNLLGAICTIIGLISIVYYGVELYKLNYKITTLDTSILPVNWSYISVLLTIKFNYIKSMITWGILFLFLGTYLISKK
jgi:hypothetical protein